MGSPVRLAGWVARRRDHGQLIFVDLRDRSGIVQLVFNPSVAPQAHAVAESLRSEFVVAISGEVVARSAETVNPGLPTGDVEVLVRDVEVLNTSRTPPFPVEAAEGEEVDEVLRLRYRYVDLRRAPMLANLELRHRVVQAARAYLHEQRFLEVETPILTKSTPEGARDFLVPSRLQPHKFYALPQSPQLFKQILMIAGTDRYYQMGRCFRDEDLRADRQPEHTQIDLEMSFMDAAEIRELVEGLFEGIFSAAGQPLTAPFPVLRFDDAMLRYGSDKPDLRYGLQIVDLSDLFGASEFQVFRGAVESGGCVRAICARGAAALSRAQIDQLTEVAKANGAKGMAYVYVEEGRALRGPVVKFLSEAEQRALVERTQAEPGDLIVFAADVPAVAAAALGALRTEFIVRLKPQPSAAWAAAWVIEFPLFEIDPESKQITYGHNPFSLPTDATIGLLEIGPACRSRGSVRPGAQRLRAGIRVVAQPPPRCTGCRAARDGPQRRAHPGVVRLPVEALEYGAPPHGGIGLGLDRIVMLLAGEQSHPRRYRLPQDGLGSRSHDRRARRSSTRGSCATCACAARSAPVAPPRAREATSGLTADVPARGDTEGCRALKENTVSADRRGVTGAFGVAVDALLLCRRSTLCVYSRGLLSQHLSLGSPPSAGSLDPLRGHPPAVAGSITKRARQGGAPYEGAWFESTYAETALHGRGRAYRARRRRRLRFHDGLHGLGTGHYTRGPRDGRD